MLRKPGRLPGVSIGIGRGVEQENHRIDIAAAGRDFPDVDVQAARLSRAMSPVPMAQTFPDVDAVFDRGGEFFNFGKVGADQRFRLIAHMGIEAFDFPIFRRPGTLAKRIP